MARGSQIARVLRFFREGDVDEVRAVLPLVEEAVNARKLGGTAKPKQRRARKARAVDVPSQPERSTTSNV